MDAGPSSPPQSEPRHYLWEGWQPSCHLPGRLRPSSPSKGGNRETRSLTCAQCRRSIRTFCLVCSRPHTPSEGNTSVSYRCRSKVAKPCAQSGGSQQYCSGLDPFLFVAYYFAIRSMRANMWESSPGVAHILAGSIGVHVSRRAVSGTSCSSQQERVHILPAPPYVVWSPLLPVCQHGLPHLKCSLVSFLASMRLSHSKLLSLCPILSRKSILILSHYKAPELCHSVVSM